MRGRLPRLTRAGVDVRVVLGERAKATRRRSLIEAEDPGPVRVPATPGPRRLAPRGLRTIEP